MRDNCLICIYLRGSGRSYFLCRRFPHEERIDDHTNIGVVNSQKREDGKAKVLVTIHARYVDTSSLITDSTNAQSAMLA